jgi:hypothetical protein
MTKSLQQKVFDKKITADGLPDFPEARISPGDFGSTRHPKPSTHGLAQHGVLMCFLR